MKAWVIWSMLTAILLAVNTLLSKVSVGRLGWRLTAIGIATGVFIGTWGIVGWKISHSRIQVAWGIPLLAGLFSGLACICFQKALTTGKVSLASAVVNGYPVLLVVMAYFFLGERLVWWQLTGIMLTVAGAVLVTWR